MFRSYLSKFAAPSIGSSPTPIKPRNQKLFSKIIIRKEILEKYNVRKKKYMKNYRSQSNLILHNMLNKYAIYMHKFKYA